jgi:hypothetical protein
MDIREIKQIETLQSERAKVAIVEVTLSDGSKVYNVEVCPDAGYFACVAFARDRAAAEKCLHAIIAACNEAASAQPGTAAYSIGIMKAADRARAARESK